MKDKKGWQKRRYERRESMYKKEELKKVFEKRKKLSACYGQGSHVVYQFIKKIWICRW